MAYNCVNVPGYSYKEGITSYCDPIQGAADNCSFIASLSSAAWVTTFIPYNLTLTNGKYTVRFQPRNVPYAVTPDLWYDPAANPKLKYARSRVETEIWPGIYEKAYALYLKGGSVCDMAELNRTNLNLWPGNAAPPLYTLLGYRVNTSNIGTDWSLSFNAIKALVKPVTPQISRPTVIWTKTGIAEGTDEMKPDHSYSVFGIFTDAANKEYLVLRNPSGQNYNQNNPNVIDNANWKVLQNYWNCTITFPQSGWKVGDNGTQNIQLGQNGFFALKPEKIPDYFAGWAFAGK